MVDESKISGYCFCLKCDGATILTNHHVYPKRFFRGEKNLKIRVCRKCHDEIDGLLPRNEKLSKAEYLEITMNWLSSDIEPKVTQKKPNKYKRRKKKRKNSSETSL